MNHAEAVAYISNIAPDFIIGPQSGNHVDVRKEGSDTPFSITLPDASGLSKDPEFVRKIEEGALADAVAAAKKVLG